MSTVAAAEPSQRVSQAVYLIGAGASHGCVTAVGIENGILMRDLNGELRQKLHGLVEHRYKENKHLEHLVNEVVDESTDYEHIITFLDQSVSSIHRAFADDLRQVFEDVLRDRLDKIEAEYGGKPVTLYEALLDMYEVEGFGESLGGILTLNYDEYIEHAAQQSLGKWIDFGISPRGRTSRGDPVRLLKLHGSFGWQDEWPIAETRGDPPLWIPPGIQKAKDRYPFNILWGLAREMLDCDVLRIVGCQLGANDWDLISLLFSTRHVNSRGRRYVVEVIDAPLRAEELSQQFPFLDVRSILELQTVGNLVPIGPRLVSEFGGSSQRPFESLSRQEKRALVESMGWDHNWFRIWLKQMAEVAFLSLESINTPSGCFQALLEEL